MKTIQILTAVAVVGLIATLTSVYPLGQIVAGLMLTIVAFTHMMALLMWVGLMLLVVGVTAYLLFPHTRKTAVA